MKIIGFNFSAINIEKYSEEYKDLKISTKIDIIDVKQVKPEVFQTKDLIIEVKFTYNIDYGEKVAKLVFSGVLLALVDPKTSKNFLKLWKDKKFPDEHKVPIFNVIMRKSNLRALQLEDELNLPLHISLPSIKDVEKEK
tara:strand:- start:438 stop:854 length:417 start_codon:yes stop_codon:yes gene_type:complete